MICFPNAKINLGLHVVGKRTDGYHDIETIFYPVPLRDALEIVPASAFSFRQYGQAVDAAPEDNLVIKALRLVEKKQAIPALEVCLKKAIPFGAGLGGGSADAAFMLKLLNSYANLRLSDLELEEMAVNLGADCPFFIRNKPVIASGIGNVFETIELSLKGYFLCVVKPDVFVATKEAYAWVKPAVPPLSLREIASMDVSGWKYRMVNDFEPSVFKQYPVIREIKEQLYTQGAIYAAMSGSGSSVFGLFEKEVDVSALFPDCFVWEGMLE